MGGQASKAAATGLAVAALAVGLLAGGAGGYAMAQVSRTDPAATAVSQLGPASRWTHEEPETSDVTITRASRWDHEEQNTASVTIPRASRWDHEEPYLVP